jgi:hypothetical protein
MASGTIFDPLALLRLTPTISSSFSLWYCVDQYLFLANFTSPANRLKGSEILPQYWRSFLRPGLTVIFSLYGTTIGSAIANLYLGPPTSSSRLYTIGTCFAAAHFAFAPLVSGLIKAIVEDESKGQSWKSQKKWLRIHAIRSVVVDLPGWVCFLMAALQSVTVV